MKKLLLIVFICSFGLSLFAQNALLWKKHEIVFTSAKEYANPIYDVKDFKITFTAPSGKIYLVRGFWDGGKSWKVRFCPGEIGIWKWKSLCTDDKNTGLTTAKSFIKKEVSPTLPVNIIWHTTMGLHFSGWPAPHGMAL
jgi:hypothetical protein